MVIRVILRAIPLLLVAAFALGVLVLDGSGARMRDMAGAQGDRLTWAHGQVKCPNPWGNLPIAACRPGNSPINPRPAH